MSKIYEALVNSRREVMNRLGTPTAESFEDSASQVKVKPEMEKEMVGLYHTINTLLADAGGKIIQFIGPREKEGTSTIIREFAITSAFTFRKSVLLLDADQRNPSQHMFFGITPERGWGDAVRDGKPAVTAFYQVGKSCLFVSPPNRYPVSTHRFFDPAGLSKLWEEARQKFDFVLIDSPPATTAFNSTALSNRTDGVILILGAETTRWQIAENIRDRIVKNGGNLLGVVFNKRRYHIPEFIYRRL